jgi:hypothetical protein
MGTKASWLVATSEQRDRLVQLLRCEYRDDVNHTDDVAYYGYNTPQGHITLIDATGDWKFQDRKTQKLISDGANVYFFSVHTGVMYSSAEAWSHGRIVWEIEHNSEFGGYHIDSDGDLPDDFYDIRDGRFEEQAREGGEEAGVDFVIEIPRDMARALTGFDGEDGIPDGVEKFYLVHRSRWEFLSRLFGGKAQPE